MYYLTIFHWLWLYIYKKLVFCFLNFTLNIFFTFVVFVMDVITFVSYQVLWFYITVILYKYMKINVYSAGNFIVT